MILHVRAELECRLDYLPENSRKHIENRTKTVLCLSLFLLSLIPHFIPRGSNLPNIALEAELIMILKNTIRGESIQYKVDGTDKSATVTDRIRTCAISNSDLNYITLSRDYSPPTAILIIDCFFAIAIAALRNRLLLSQLDDRIRHSTSPKRPGQADDRLKYWATPRPFLGTSYFIDQRERTRRMAMTSGSLDVFCHGPLHQKMHFRTNPAVAELSHVIRLSRLYVSQAGVIP
ncbi:hypothetical protein J6590_046793 [Homalodisca vitripennis]|nr:hypothetical protein J6590_046793 [Homalodisca vitripennis]